MATTRISGGHVFHEDVVGQANPKFAHRLDWSRYCTICPAVFGIGVGQDGQRLADRAGESDPGAP